MSVPSELRIRCLAQPSAARPLRHAVAAFLAALGVDGDVKDGIVTAVGEAVANSVEHAYVGRSLNDVELYAHFVDASTLAVEVCDYGCFIERGERAGRTFGLRIVRAIADSVQVESNGGTRLHMRFNLG